VTTTLQSRVTYTKRNHIKHEKSREPDQHSFTTTIIMPPQRTPLGSISCNYLPNKHYSPYQRVIIAGKASEGATPTKIATDLKFACESIRRTVALDLIRHEGESLPRKPRNKSYSDLEERHILRWVRLRLKSIYKEVIAGCGVKCSKTTVKRILKEHGITN
jgi:transposase